jgi:microsomal dipeptidase-like Zn-dependent dipeptidase
MRKGAFLSVEGLERDADVKKLLDLLAQRGHSPDTIDGIMGENFLRVFEEVVGV